MKFLAAFLTYLPGILKAVVDIQTAVGNSVPGASKKQLVMNAISIAAKAGENIPESHVAGISAMIDSTVKTFKDSGVFGADGSVAVAEAVVPTPLV